MKKQLLLLCLFFVLVSQAQQPVVFCPPGAKWHYNFDVYGMMIYKINRTAEYIGDTIVDNETIKIIRHPQINRNCGGCYTTRTYIKQYGDTVFMKNACSSGWQILYNFATPIGGQWTSVYDNSTYTVTVDTIKTITVNGVNLKQLITSITGLYYKEAITERIGGNYLFYFYKIDCSDGVQYSRFLCYQDSMFGLYQANSTIACDYASFYVGVDELESNNEEFKSYPNPANEISHIESNVSIENLFVSIIDMYGREVKQSKLQKEIDVKDLSSGIYVLIITNQNKETLYQQKLVKE